MRFLPSTRLWAVILAAVAVAGLLRAQPEREAKEVEVGPLIKQLGDDDYERREAATKELEDIGHAALPAIQKAAIEGEDFEVRWRARQLVRAILNRSRATGMEFALIYAGEFSMGSPAAETGRRSDEVQHKVRIARPFLLGTFEVTQREYELVMKTNPSWFSATGGGKKKLAAEETSRFPVEKVTWFDAVEYCNRLSKLDGFPPYYTLSGEKVEGGSIKSATVKIAGGHGYRLPTEAEWEYAARAGTSGAFFFGAENTGREANIKPVMVPGGYGASPKWRDNGRTIKVGTHPPNRWGLFDMHGNVAEWCEDWYGRDYYETSPKDDPPGPASGNQRVQRGGSWLDHEPSCRSASRFWNTPDESKEFAGFRVARTP